MASEPSEEAITNFVNFTSTSREHAIRFLKVSRYHRPSLYRLYADIRRSAGQ